MTTILTSCGFSLFLSLLFEYIYFNGSFSQDHIISWVILLFMMLLISSLTCFCRDWFMMCFTSFFGSFLFMFGTILLFNPDFFDKKLEEQQTVIIIQVFLFLILGYVGFKHQKGLLRKRDQSNQDKKFRLFEFLKHKSEYELRKFVANDI